MKSICEQCNNEFEQKRPREPKRFCSCSCSAKARDKKTIKGIFLKGQTAWNKGLVGFRSGYKHKVATIEKLRSPKNIPNKKTPQDLLIRKTHKYKQWKKEIIVRDRICQSCSSDTNLHAHHIITVKEDISKALDITNGVALCRSCHAKKHDFGGFYKKFTGKKAELTNG